MKVRKLRRSVNNKMEMKMVLVIMAATQDQTGNLPVLPLAMKTPSARGENASK